MPNIVTEVIPAAARKFPSGETFRLTAPPGRDCPGMAVSAPLNSMRKAETVLEEAFAAYRNLPLEVSANEMPKIGPLNPEATGGSGKPVTGSCKEWKTKHEGQIKSEAHALHESLGSLAKVLDAIKDYPAGQKLIVFGIIILIIAGLFGGISGL